METVSVSERVGNWLVAVGGKNRLWTAAWRFALVTAVTTTVLQAIFVLCAGMPTVSSWSLPPLTMMFLGTALTAIGAGTFAALVIGTVPKEKADEKVRSNTMAIVLLKNAAFTLILVIVYAVISLLFGDANSSTNASSTSASWWNYLIWVLVAGLIVLITFSDVRKRQNNTEALEFVSDRIGMLQIIIVVMASLASPSYGPQFEVLGTFLIAESAVGFAIVGVRKLLERRRIRKLLKRRTTT